MNTGFCNTQRERGVENNPPWMKETDFLSILYCERNKLKRLRQLKCNIVDGMEFKTGT